MPDPATVCRVVLRLASFSLHALAGFVIALAAFPLLSPRQRVRVQQRWAHSLLAGLGVTLLASGKADAEGMLVANHVSWLDVLALSALAPAAFVAKYELRRWPVAGILIARSGGIFLRRQRLRDILRVNAELHARLRDGWRVAVFPEGTTTDGSRVAPFRCALLQPAVERGLALQPVAISFHDAEGRRAAAACYHGDIGFGASLLAVAAAPRLSARLRFAPPVATRGLCRRRAGALARDRILEALDEQQLAPGSPAAPQARVTRITPFTSFTTAKARFIWARSDTSKVKRM